MVKQLNRRITVINIVAILIVILVGGISIFLTQNILHNGYKIEEESRHIKIFDDLNTDAYRLVLSIHHFLIEPDKVYAVEAMSLLNKIEDVTTKYRAMELKEEYAESEQEVLILDGVIEDIKELKNIVGIFKNFEETGHFDREALIGHEEFAYRIESAAKHINKIHFDKIAYWEKESISKMWRILLLYLLFITFGGLSIYIGHMLLSKNVVRPIKELAAATIEFSEGTYNKRVYTESRTEIGQLYQSFNQMAERLQENDEILRKFNDQLERKVRERTTELQKANEQLRMTQSALIRTERIAAVGQIAAGVTHEIKNPLNSLSINTQMLIRELSDNLGAESSVYETATMIKSEINRINNILEQFVKFARFPEPVMAAGDINSIVRDVSGLYTENARESGISITELLEESLPDIRFDEKQIREVLINLMQNALRAMKEGGAVEVRTLMSDGNVIIRVKDSGEGIPEKNLDQIFSPFFSTREGGMGLGLSIVQRIVESHGGKIVCQSSVGKGTAFEIVMPLEKEQVQS